MGEYTGMRFSAKLKPQAEELIKLAMREYLVNLEAVSWWDIMDKYWKVDNTFMRYSRKNSIPFGGVCYMPDDWQSSCSIQDSVWNVCCSMKDIGYHGFPMVDYFSQYVLPALIEEPCRVEVRFERYRDSWFNEVQPAELVLR